MLSLLFRNHKERGLKMLKDIIKKPKLNTLEALIVSRNIYKNNSKTFLMILLLAWIPINIILTILTFKVGEISLSPKIFTDIEFAKQFAASEGGQLFILYNIVANLIVMFFKPIGLMAIALVSRDFIFEHNTNFKTALKIAFSKGVYMIPAVILYFILTSAGFMFFVIPGIMVMILLYYYLYAIILDNKTTLSSLKQSFMLTNRSIIKSGITIGIVMLMNYLVSYGIDSLLYWGYNNFIIQIISRSLCSFFDIIFVIVFTIIYLNRLYNNPNLPNPTAPVYESDSSKKMNIDIK